MKNLDFYRTVMIKPTLLKHPLIYFDNKIKSYGSHGIGYANVADISCVLYHYKFTDKFMERVNKAVIEENYYSDSREYKAYKKTHEEMGEIELDSKYLKKLTSIDDLLNDGFLQVTSDYKNWVHRFLMMAAMTELFK